MPFDLIAWFESAGKNGLTATTAVTDTRYGSTGDTHTLRAIANPVLAAAWQASVTAAKSEQAQIQSDLMAISPNIAGGQVRDNGEAVLLGVPLNAQDVLTGYHDNANTAEISGFVAAIAYGGKLPIYSPFPVKAPKAVMGLSSTTDTVGALPVGWVAASTTWTGLKRDERYEILGVAGWGTLDVAARFAATSELGAAFKCGVPLSTTPVSARMYYLSEPYPFLGSSPPSIEIMSIGASAEHHLSILLG